MTRSILDAIGNTSIVQLSRVVPPGCARIFVKLEWENPTGSMKDRVAQAMIARAEEDGRLKPGDTVVEYTGGSTGISLALICGAKGYKLIIVSSDAFSKEKLAHMASFGAELVIIPSDNGRITKELIQTMIATAKDLSAQPNRYWTDQLNNQDSFSGYYPLGEEIWQQTNGRLDAFVHSIGTGASSRGVATILKKHNPNVKLYIMEPSESAVLSGGGSGAHKIEGIGIGFTPPLLDRTMVERFIPVSTDESKVMARRLAREEGIFAGTSSGGNVVAAIQVARELGSDATVVTLMVDSGLKYMSTDLYTL